MRAMIVDLVVLNTSSLCGCSTRKLWDQSYVQEPGGTLPYSRKTGESQACTGSSSSGTMDAETTKCIDLWSREKKSC